jgi:hypothetical protein
LLTTDLPTLARLSGGASTTIRRGRRAPGQPPFGTSEFDDTWLLFGPLDQAAHSVCARFLSIPDFSAAIAYPKSFKSGYFPRLLTWQHLPTPTRADETKPAIAHPNRLPRCRCPLGRLAELQSVLDTLGVRAPRPPANANRRSGMRPRNCDRLQTRSGSFFYRSFTRS